jgi:hypothetical protein
VGLGSSYEVLLAPDRIGFIRPSKPGERVKIATLTLVGASQGATVVPGKRTGSEASSFRGSDPKQWRSHVPDYDSVTLHEVYPGLDVRFYEQGTRLEFDIEARPGADLNRLRMRVDGDSVRVLSDGALALGEGKSSINIKIPAAYQIDGSAHRLPVSASFTGIGDHEVRHKTGKLDSSLVTVVDPTVAFSTLIESGPGEQGANDMNIDNVAADSSGNVWVAGTTYGPLSEPSSNPVLNCEGCTPGQWAAVVFAAKFAPSGNLLVTVALGETPDNTVGMVLDASGYVYLDRDVESGINFPVTTGAYQTTNSSNDIFVAKIDSTGSALVWSSYLGGSQDPHT